RGCWSTASPSRCGSRRTATRHSPSGTDPEVRLTCPPETTAGDLTQLGLVAWAHGTRGRHRRLGAVLRRATGSWAAPVLPGGDGPGRPRAGAIRRGPRLW